MALSLSTADSSMGSEKRHSLSLLVSEELKLIVTQNEVRKAGVDAQRHDSVFVPYGKTLVRAFDSYSFPCFRLVY